MFDPRKASKEHATFFRAELKRREEELDQARRAIHADKVAKAITGDALELVMAHVEALRLFTIQLSGLVRTHEAIAAGRVGYSAAE